MFILRRGPLWVKARRQVQQHVERGAATTERPVEKQRRPSHLRSLHTFTNYILLAADKLFMWAVAFFFFAGLVPFPCSNPGSNKRGLTSVTRAYNSPPLQMERAEGVRSKGLRSAVRGEGQRRRLKDGKVISRGNRINARQQNNKGGGGEWGGENLGRR